MGAWAHPSHESDDMKSFGIRKTLHATYDDALLRVPEALKAEGFGVLTEIDVKSTLKQKIGVDFRRYKILGACNPSLAHEALTAELEIGLTLHAGASVLEQQGHDSVEIVMRKPSRRRRRGVVGDHVDHAG